MSIGTSIQLELPISYGSDEIVELDPLKLFTYEQIEQMRENGKQEHHGKDHVPVAFILSTRTRSQFLLTELHPENPNIAYGIADIRHVGIQKGFIDLMELVNQIILTEKLKNPETLIPDNGAFNGKKPLSEYLKLSCEKGFLFTNDQAHVDLVGKYFTSGVERLDLNL